MGTGRVGHAAQTGPASIADTFTALPPLAVGGTMLTVPVVHPTLNNVRHRGRVNQAGS